ncbi:MAG: hypothetical protein A3B38_00790 [Candidatus Levybacteria bacterium RIFCSPLOWO2_01_FULL_36_13]|nr:MAG: hypothetical protein A2684_02030 [Candidatus Levybacteria bacterium RIFCSPHIGHO2_01_FULL_36_15b]OGH35425.1 MAG: hypothetical protein A3B38_00790 [Candidatus Levybacteria bacterium RIFCSPLOWO2_01_FULL_36_13]
MNVLPINLPKEGTPKVKAGDEVKKGQIIAQVVLEDNEVIHLSSYNIASNKFAESLKKHLGDLVASGDIVAVKKRLLGGIKVYSPFSGILVKIDEQNQDLFIKPKDFKEKKDILSPVDGVVEFCDNTKISIKTDSLVISAKDILGPSVKGEILAGDFEIDNAVDDKIIVRETFDKLSAFKSFGLGALGLITKDLSDFDFMDLEKDFEKTIVMVSEDDFKKLAKYKGKMVAIDSAGKIIYL